MRPDHFNNEMFNVIDEKCRELEDKLASDVGFYHGSIYPQYFLVFRDFVEQVKLDSKRSENAISVVLRTAVDRQKPQSEWSASSESTMLK